MTAVHRLGRNFDRVVGRAELAIVDFSAEWCPPCRHFAPVFDRAAARHPDMLFGMVDVAAEQALATQHRVAAIPTLVVFRDGIEVLRRTGSMSDDALEQLIASGR